MLQNAWGLNFCEHSNGGIIIKIGLLLGDANLSVCPMKSGVWLENSHLLIKVV